MYILLDSVYILGETNIPGGTVKHVYSPKRKGQGKAGFARPGLIVTSEGLTLEALAQDPRYSLFQEIAHEIAHGWWNFGAGQGDWINEAFAEYFSALAVEQLVSEDKFRGIMADYRKQANRLAADSPSLATVPPMGQTSFVIRYYKGAAMLDTFAPNHGRREVLSDEPRVLSELAKMRIVDVRAGIPAACEGGTSYKRPQNDGLPGGSAA